MTSERQDARRLGRPDKEKGRGQVGEKKKIKKRPPRKREDGRGSCCIKKKGEKDDSFTTMPATVLEGGTYKLGR